MTMNAEVESIFTFLRQVKLRETRGGGLADDVKLKLDLLCSYFSSAPEDARRAVTECIRPELSFLFFIHADNMALQAVREKSEQRLLIGLEALAVENCTFDWRDSTIRMALLYHSAKLIGVDPEAAFKQIAGIAMPRASARFIAFAARDSEKKSLAQFRFKEGKTASGEFMYETVQ